MDGKKKLRFVKRIKKFGVDDYAIEIYDSKGQIKAKLIYLSPLREGFIQYDDKKMIELRNGEFIENPASDYKAE